jgi:hypothetical protein
MTTATVDPVLCMALFVSDTPCTNDPDCSSVRAAVESTLEQLGPDECYARAAEVFGDRPEVALDRIRWARRVCAEAFARGSRR